MPDTCDKSASLRWFILKINSFFFEKKRLVLVKPDQIVSYVIYVNNLYDLVYFVTRVPDTCDKSASLRWFILKINSFFFEKKRLVLVKPDQIVSYVTYVNNLYDLVYFITREPDTCDKSAKRATRKRQEPHECDTSATQTTQVQVKKIDFDNNTSENIFSQLYIRYMGSKRLKGEKQFHSKNYLLQNALFSWQTAFQKWIL